MEMRGVVAGRCEWFRRKRGFENSSSFLREGEPLFSVYWNILQSVIVRRELERFFRERERVQEGRS
ncbi:hypothetical protein COLO4_33323 [Corchorus olitorius]|uniref:Uncharacterized protein n=1 Tax=Corchorus olitorius TaxID=93759 RepID=A0A1R3GUM8_9ROSI|nr:hypothetical protein COLO4_33323 [Corchorus olitorius]